MAIRNIARPSVETFYVVGGTLARDAPSYVERAADKRLFTALQQSEICYVLTSRQMGKSSLMVRTAVRLREEGTSVAVLDLTSLGQNLSAQQWYNGLLERTGQQLSLEDEIEEAWAQSEQRGPFQHWVQVMRDVVLPACPNRLVVFIDEIDSVRSLPFPTDEFFAGIRELYNRRSEEPELKRLTFCLLGVATPSDLIRDTRTTPFNVGRRIELTDFTAGEAAPLALGLGGEHAIGEKLLKRVLYWTGGHPYLTQRLCQAVSEDGKLGSTKSVDEICNDLFLSHRARERDDNLLFVRDRILRSEVDTASLLILYSKVRAGKKVRDDEADPLIGVLRLSGVVAVDDGYLKVRNRIYHHVFDQDWITANLPGAEVRRVRAAYRKGLRRAAIFALPAVVLALLGGYYLYSVNTTPPNLSHQMHPTVPPFWLSSSMNAPNTPTGSLRIKTGQENVTVFINNQQYGTTGQNGELLVPALPVGTYNIRLEAPRFQTVNTPGLPIFANTESPLAVSLQRLTILEVLKVAEAAPDTSVHLDGNYVGATDANGLLSTMVSPGDHHLELSKDGFISQSLIVHVSLDNAGDPPTVTVSGKLKPDQELTDWRALANSKDPNEFQSYRKKYPDGRFAGDALKKAESLDWDIAKGSNDPEQFDAFARRYPGTPLAEEAQRRMAQVQQELEDYKVALNSSDPNLWIEFLSKHPNSYLASAAKQQFATMKDRKAILDVVQQYRDAYDRKDLDAILRLWPKITDRKKQDLTMLFRDGQTETLELEPKGQPEIAADHARVVCEKTRNSQGMKSKANVQIQFIKEAGSWLIESGTL